MSSTDRRTDRRTDGQMDGQGESSIPPSNFVGRGYNNNNNDLYCRLPEYIEKYTKDPILKDIVCKNIDEERQEKTINVIGTPKAWAVSNC